MNSKDILNRLGWLTLGLTILILMNFVLPVGEKLYGFYRLGMIISSGIFFFLSIWPDKILLKSRYTKYVAATFFVIYISVFYVSFTKSIELANNVNTVTNQG